MESSKKKNFRKKMAATVSAVLVVALLLAGTYAYLAGSSALNQWQGRKEEAGGVGRDDYKEGEANKDVFVENKGNTILYARIKLEEYFEMTRTNGTKEILVGEPGATKTPSEGWITHMDGPQSDGRIPLDSVTGDDGEAHKYWEWLMGGSKVYMPSPDSAVTEDKTLNGDAYSDTTPYEEDDMENNKALKKTPKAEVMTYQQWFDKGKPAGNYWVIDDDGWIYWANPILPGEATGLLLDAVTGPEKSKFPEDWKDYYYAINVNFEFWDADDWDGKYGEAGDGGKEVLDAAKGDQEPTANKETLKELIDQAKDIKNNHADEYSEDENWDNLYDVVLPAGEDVYESEDATQEEVDQAIIDLQNALDALTRTLKLLETETNGYIHVQFYKSVHSDEMEVEEDWSYTYDMSKILENPAEATTLTVKSATLSGDPFIPVTLKADELIGQARVEDGVLKPWVVFPFESVKEYFRVDGIVSDLTLDVVVNFSQNVMVEGSPVTLTSKDYTIHIEYIDSSMFHVFED